MSFYNFKSVIFFCVLTFCVAKDCSNVKRTNSKLICYYSSLNNVDNCYCTHVVIPANTEASSIERLREKLTGVKILLTVNEFNEGLIKTIKQNQIDGLELNLKKLSSKDDITEFINTVRTKLGNDLFLALSIPPKTELLAKYYDLKSLTKSTDLFILQTAFLGASKNATFHPSRLSGLWDMQNTDSVVDLITGLGAPLSRLVITSPVQAFHFKLQDSSLTTPGSPALELSTISRKELCQKMDNKDGESWTLERDQDQAGPYIFREKDWIAFEDAISVDIKAKYSRVRGLAGLALKDLSQDIVTVKNKNSNNEDEEQSSFCDSILLAAHQGLAKQTRAPRQAVLRSLEREILETPLAPIGGSVHVSPFRITKIVDVEGHVHDVRKDTRTEFSCSRQGYFVHPRSCGRFYRCVKFDQLVDEFSVFEFDCPAGLVFDERVEVCVWPGNLQDGAPCHGSSEIAPVPRNRYACPGEAGYYADPENCRWFFACLDHGKSGLTAYEFRCPFGLVFDEKRLLCEWPWLVPTCGSGYLTGLELDHVDFYGGVAKSTIIPGSGEGRFVNAGQNVLVAGAQLIDSYDGLGSLGHVALGGYNGDLNLLKQNIQLSSGLEANNLAYVNQESDNNGQYVLNSALNTNYQSDGSSISSSTNDQSKIGVIHFGTNIGNTAQANSNLYQSNVGSLTSGYDGANLNIGKYSSESLGVGLQTDQLVDVIDVRANSEASSIQYQENSGSAHSQGSIVPIQSSVQLENNAYSGSLDYNYAFANEANYKVQPVVATTSFDNKFSHNIGYTPKADIFKIEKITPAVHYEQKNLVTPLIQPQTLGYSSSYQYQQPIFQYAPKVQPVLATQVKIPVIQKQTVVPIKQIDYSAYHHQYQAPILQQYAQHVQPVVTQVKLPVIQKESGYSSSYLYQTPAVQYQPKVVQPLVTEYKQPLIHQQTGYSSSYQYQAPVTQYEQKLIQPVVTEVKQPIIQYEQKVVQPIVTKVEQPVVHQQTYQYQAPVVQYEQKVVQPLITEVKQPVIHKQTGYSSSYHYQAPITQYEQKVIQPVVTEVKQPVIQYEQKLIQPIVTKVEQPVVHRQTYHYQPSAVVQPIITEVKQPVIQYEQKVVQPLITKIEQPVVHKQTGYSSTYHYQAPITQYEHKVVQPVVTEVKQPVIQYQQPVVTKIEQPIIQKQTGYSSSYHYQAPAVTEIKQPVIQYHQPLVTKIEQPIIQKQTGYSSSYHYQAPAVQYEQNVVQPVVTEVKQPVIQYEQKIVQPLVTKIEQPVVHKQTSYSTGYHYQAPAIQYEQKTLQPVIQQQTIYKVPEIKQTYHYQTPVVQPVVTEIKKPVIQYEQKIVQPLITEVKTPIKQTGYSSYYQYQTPTIYKQKLQPVVTEIKAPVNEFKQTGYSNTYQYQTPVVHYEQKVQPIITEVKTPVVTQAPIIYEQKVQQPAVVVSTVQPPVTHHYYDKRIHEVKIPVVQQPSAFVTPKYETHHYQQHVQIPTIQKQEFIETVTPKYETQYYGTKVEHKIQPITYEGKVPVVEEKIVPVKAYQTYTTAAPKQIITQYDSREYLPPKPVIKPQIYLQPKLQEVYVSTTPKYAVFQEYVQPKQTFEIKKKVVPVVPTYETYIPPQPVTKIKQHIIYSTPKPKYEVFQEYIQPKQTIEIKKPASPTIISQYEYVNPAYTNYESKLNLNLEQDYQPTAKPVEQYHTQTAFIPLKNYQTDYIVSTPKPTFISTIAPVLKQTPTLKTKIVAINKYESYDNQQFVSTPKPVYVSTPAPESSLPPFRYYDSRLDNQYFKETVSSAVVPRKKIASTTTPIPLEIYADYYDDKYDSKYIVEAKPTVTTFKPEIKKYLVSTTPKTIYYDDIKYAPQKPKVVTTAQPVSRKKIVTSTKTYEEDYVVSTTRSKKKKITTAAPILYEEYGYEDYISSERPKFESVKITPRPKAKGKTVVRVNDFHPLLTTKLGAECTCTSNPIKLRNRGKDKQQFSEENEDLLEYEIPENVPITKLTSSGPASYDDYNEPGVYQVGNADIIDEDYDDDIKKVISVTKSPEVIIKSTTNAIQPAPTPIYTIRKKITTSRTPTDETEVSNKYSSRTSQSTKVEEIFYERPSTRSRTKEAKIAEAVSEGLSLVKSAVKSAVKEAIQEDNRNFDRYGPGGWRSRDETLQGSIDCQREGLFRHPTQCNKFYACHWDCTKKRYTLHVFNCPVHLTFDTSQGACNWPSKGPACSGNTLLPNS